MAERSGAVTFKGDPLTLCGDGEIKVGEKLPDLKVSKTLKDDIKLSDFRGKTLVLNVVPSLDTPVCSTQTARFNKEAIELGDNVQILTVSMDLPVAQARWCQANNVDNMQTASDYKHREFGEKCGLKIKELGLLARSVIVADKDGIVRYAEIVKEVSSEPNYDAALDALKKI